MKKYFINLLFSLCFIVPLKGTESHDTQDEFESKPQYSQPSWSLNEALMGRQVREIDQNIKSQREHPIPMNHAKEVDDDNDCLFLYYCFGMCFCIL